MAWVYLFGEIKTLKLIQKVQLSGSREKEQRRITWPELFEGRFALIQRNYHDNSYVLFDS